MDSTQELASPLAPRLVEPLVPCDPVFGPSGDRLHFFRRRSCRLQFCCVAALVAGFFPSVEGLNIAVPVDSTGVGAVVGVQDGGFVLEVRGGEEGVDEGDCRDE